MRTADLISLRVINRALLGFARACECRKPISKGFRFLGLHRVAPYCAPGSVRVVSDGDGLGVAGSCPSLLVYRYAALADVAIAHERCPNCRTEATSPQAVDTRWRMLMSEKRNLPSSLLMKNPLSYPAVIGVAGARVLRRWARRRAPPPSSAPTAPAARRGIRAWRCAP